MAYIETVKYNIDSNGNTYGAAIHKQYSGSTAAARCAFGVLRTDCGGICIDSIRYAARSSLKS